MSSLIRELILKLNCRLVSSEIKNKKNLKEIEQGFDSSIYIINSLSNRTGRIMDKESYVQDPTPVNRSLDCVLRSTTLILH